MSNNSYSIVEIFGGQTEGHRCGYCKSPSNSLSYGMWAHSMTIQDYQDLIDRGWRRSGKYCYKPIMDKTCCPSYTIRCNTTEFKLSKSQKKVLRRMHHYLSYGGNTKEPGEREIAVDTECAGGEPCEQFDMRVVLERSRLAQQNMQEKTVLVSSRPTSIKPVDGMVVSSGTEKDDVGVSNAEAQCLITECMESSGPRQPNKGSGADPLKPPCRKAKVLRMEKKKLRAGDKSNAQKITANSVPANQHHQSKPLREYLNEPLPAEPAHTLEIRLVRSQPASAAFLHSFDDTYDLYRKYQMTVHRDPPTSCTSSQFNRFLVNSPLEIRLVRSQPSSPELKASLDVSYSVYRRFQMTIIGESESEVDMESYVEFLVDSSLKPEESSEQSHPGYGSFHQQYWLDGKMVAVGVLDILPHCVSSVYFYYDPAYSFLSLGTYGALREIDFVQQLSRCTSNLKYYYMGFYIHSCVKMRYKGRFYPSHLLCPEVYSWHPLKQVQHKLDASKYSRLNDNNDQDERGKVTSKDIMVLQRQRPISYEEYLARSTKVNKEHEEVMEYGRYVGLKCAPRMLLFRK